MTFREINDIKEHLESKTSKGFGYFIKNVAMVVLIIFAIMILTNPEFITNPSQFFSDISLDSLWVVLSLFLAVTGFVHDLH